MGNRGCHSADGRQPILPSCRFFEATNLREILKSDYRPRGVAGLRKKRRDAKTEAEPKSIRGQAIGFESRAGVRQARCVE